MYFLVITQVGAIFFSVSVCTVFDLKVDNCFLGNSEHKWH